MLQVEKQIKNIAFRWSIIILSITFEHNLYYLVPFSLRYIINTHLIQYTCDTKIFSSVSDKCTWVLHQNLRFLITIIIVFSAHKYFIDFFKKMWHVTYQNNP